MSRYITERALTPSGRRLTLTLDAESYEAHPAAREFVMYLDGSGKAENTIRTYVPRVTHFLNWCAAQGHDWTQVVLPQMVQYKWLIENEVIKTGRRRSAASVNNYLAAVMEFLRFCGRHGHMDSEIASKLSSPRYLTHLPSGMDGGEDGQNRTIRARELRVRTTEKPPAILTTEQIEELLSSCRTPRARFLALLLGVTGVRIGEALGLRRSDMHLLPDSTSLGCSIKGAHLHIIRRQNSNSASAKSHAPRHIPVGRELASAYAEYMHERASILGTDDDSDFVVVNLYAEPLGQPSTYSAIYTWIKTLGEKGGFRARPHMLRHTAATRWLHESGATLDEVQALLGHASASSTAVYLHPDNDQLRRAVEAGSIGKASTHE